MSKPLIAIDNETREMTDEEYSQHLKDIAAHDAIDLNE
jgi:hypothetical protein